MKNETSAHEVRNYVLFQYTKELEINLENTLMS